VRHGEKVLFMFKVQKGLGRRGTKEGRGPAVAELRRADSGGRRDQNTGLEDEAAADIAKAFRERELDQDISVDPPDRMDKENEDEREEGIGEGER
jgi:hypothetical protein